jgi:hypothetical protein
MPALWGACKHPLAIQILPTMTEVHSFGHRRIGVRREKLSDRGGRSSFLASIGMALAQTAQTPSTSIRPHLGEGPDETINGRRALALADEVIE